jgi:hypothetical protein
MPREPPAEVMQRDLSATWFPNPMPNRTARNRAIALLVDILAISLTVFFLSYMWMPRDMLFLAAVIGMGIAAVIGFSSEVFLNKRINPNDLGLSEKGVHFWYATPGLRLLNRLFIPWDDVLYIGYRGIGKKRYLYFKCVDDNHGWIDLNPENEKRLEEAGRRRGKNVMPKPKKKKEKRWKPMRRTHPPINGV